MPNEAEPIFIEKSPAIVGLRFRHVSDAWDTEALFSVHEQCADHDQTDRLSSIEHAPTQEDLARWLSQAVRTERTSDWLMAHIAEEIVGYSGIVWWTEKDGLWVYLTTGWVVPSWRGKGIGTALLHWAETRIQTLASEHLTDGNWEYASNATNTEVEATAMLRDNGYYAAYTVLDMELTDFSRVPEPTLPAGLARGLLAFGLRALQERGVSTVRLHTVSEFPTQAKNLYGSVGFHARKAFLRYRKPQDANREGEGSAP